MRRLTFDLMSDGPMLQHNPASMLQQNGAKKGVSRREIPAPEAEAEAGLYKNEDGTLYFPAVGVRNSMLSGAKGTRIGKIAAGTVLSGVVLLDQETFPMTDGEGAPLIWNPGWNEALGRYANIDARRCIIQKAGIIRCRPRIDPTWVVRCSFLFDEDVMGDNIQPVIDCLERAGKMIGLGDYRMEKKGWFGRNHPENARLV